MGDYVALDPLVEYFEMSMLAGAMFLSIFEMQIYLSLKKSIFLGIIIPIAIFLYCICDVWKGSLTAALHFLFYDSERAIPIILILVGEFIVCKVYKKLKQ